MDKKLRTPSAAILLIITSFFMLSNFSFFFEHIKYGAPVAMLLRSYIFTFLRFAINLAISFVLFAKKRNNSLLIVLGCAALLNLIILIRAISIMNLLAFAAYGLLVVFAIPFCEQTLIKADMSKIKEISNKFYFLPAILSIAASVFSWVKLLGQEGYFIPFRYVIRQIIRYPLRIGSIPGMTIISDLLGALVLLSIAQWLRDPYAKPQRVSEATNDGTYVDEEYDEAYCGLGKHIVLCLFTFGIWYLIWTYRTTKYLNKAPHAVQYNPTSKLLLCMFVPFYQIYWFYKHGQRIDAMSKQKKLNNSDMATLCLILGIFIPIVACILMQDRINILCTTKAVVEEPKAEDSTIEQLKKYKELLDSGVISQEEFDEKKKQLLGL